MRTTNADRIDPLTQTLRYSKWLREHPNATAHLYSAGSASKPDKEQQALNAILTTHGFIHEFVVTPTYHSKS